MDFELSDEQAMLRDTVRDVLGKSYGIETLREVTDTELGWSREVWKHLADIGILGLTFPDAVGGSGAGPQEVAAVMTEFGRALAPEPYLDSVLVPGSLIAATADDAASAELLGALASGELLLAFAHCEPGDRWPGAAVAASVVDGNLTGSKSLVPHGDCADKVIVSAREGNEVGLYLVDTSATGVTVTGYRTHDQRRGARIDFESAPALRLGAGDATAAIADTEIAIQSAQCAEAVGAMERVLEMTVQYLKSRKQFGVTLSAFQALTHRAADMYMQLELARSMSLYLSTALSEGIADRLIASRAKLQICRSGRQIGQEAIQMHGGIGMTAEYPVGHYVSRLTAIFHTLGNADDHLAALSANIDRYDLVSLT